MVLRNLIIGLIITAAFFSCNEARGIDLKTIRSTLEEVQAALNQLQDAISSAETKVLTQLGLKAFNVILDMYQTINDAQTAYATVTQDIESLINNAANEAIANGSDVSGCVKYLHQDLIDIVGNHTANLASCLNGPINSAMQLFAPAQDQMNSFHYQMADFQTQLTACVDSDCYTNLLNSVNNLIPTVTEAADLIVEQAIEWNTQIQEVLPPCLDSADVDVNEKLNAYQTAKINCINGV